MKKIVKLIAENKRPTKDYVAQLNEALGDAIAILPYSIDEEDAYLPQQESAILTSAFSAANFSELKRTRLRGKTLIPIELSLPRKELYRLDVYPKGTPALLVNVSKFMAEETIAQLYQSGYSNLTFYPWYPGSEVPHIPLAVTPGEADLVPDFVTECIDLGPRLIDIVTIIELAAKLKCEYLLRAHRFFDYFERQYTTSAGVSILVHENQLLEQRLATLIQMFREPLVGIDQNGGIFDCNFPAAEVAGVSRTDLLQSQSDRLIPQSLLERIRTQQVPLSGVATDQAGENRAVRVIPITQGPQYWGAYAALSTSGGRQSEKKDDLLSSGKGHVAKYSFSDVCGHSAQIKHTVELARKMARTESSVLITGESGTGKELFAHAIHNSSTRSEAPFVAINCAALPNDLLESELFGYEEGAFTGARRGGKIGLFELANTGSIFLDEVEGMAPSTQLKLLRVIQEREMMRVGGDRVIPIDVRIISASNQNMTALIQQGQFRQDLFYRIGTLPLDLPPLRKRREDILPLLENFKNALRLTFVLTEEAKSILQRYSWPGNIRELRNCVEYMGCQNIPVIGADELPPLIHASAFGNADCDLMEDGLQTAVLKILSCGRQGRKQLLQSLSYMGNITEGQLRRILEELKALGYITSTTGRGGSSLTPSGIQELKNRLK